MKGPRTYKSIPDSGKNRSPESDLGSNPAWLFLAPMVHYFCVPRLRFLVCELGGGPTLPSRNAMKFNCFKVFGGVWQLLMLCHAMLCHYAMLCVLSVNVFSGFLPGSVLEGTARTGHGGTRL